LAALEEALHGPIRDELLRGEPSWQAPAKADREAELVS
jgi:hypothetical protein